MKRLNNLLLTTILMVLLIAPLALAPTVESNSSGIDSGLIINDIIHDYEFFTSLLQDVYLSDNYLVSANANNYDSAAAYLAQGFDQTLAENMAAYFFMYLPESNQLAVIPAESIPVITAADKPYLELRRISPDQVVFKRVYNDCYEPGDRYLYQITARFSQGHWIICDLQLDTP